MSELKFNKIEYQRKYRKINKDKINIKRREYKELRKEHIREMDRLWYSRNKQKRIEVQQQRYRTIEGRFTHWKKTAKSRNIDWGLTLDDLKSMALKCYYTGVELTFDPGKSNTISLDRLDSNFGYTKENVVFCCWRVNLAKSDLSCSDFFKMCLQVVNYKVKNERN